VKIFILISKVSICYEQDLTTKSAKATGFPPFLRILSTWKPRHLTTNNKGYKLYQLRNKSTQDKFLVKE